MPETLALGFLSAGQLLVVAGIVAFVVYRRRLPEIARALGRYVAEFKRGLKDLENETPK